LRLANVLTVRIL